MGRKTSRKIKATPMHSAPTPPAAVFEPTPERRAQAGAAANDRDGHSFLTEAKIEKAGERKVLTRRFADSQIDRMLKGKRLTYAQWYAADWYRMAHEQAGLGARVVSNYDQGASGGASSIGSKLLGSERQYEWRKRWRAAREVIPERGRGLVDRLVLEDRAPVYRNGQQRARHASTIGQLLNPLAEWLGAAGRP